MYKYRANYKRLIKPQELFLLERYHRPCANYKRLIKPQEPEVPYVTLLGVQIIKD